MFLLHCIVAYVIGHAMLTARHSLTLGLFLCVLLTACAPAAKKSNVLDLYELPRAGQGTTIYITPVDNDNYYVQPMGYKGCAQIGDSPSCGGG